MIGRWYDDVLDTAPEKKAAQGNRSAGLESFPKFCTGLAQEEGNNGGNIVGCRGLPASKLPDEESDNKSMIL